MSHRKLFPAETKTNQTLNCYGFCDPSCPYNCYTNPNYFYFPPPPPQHSNQANHISSYLIIIISLFLVIFILVGFYMIKVKCYAEMCGWRSHGSGSARSQTQEFLDDGQLDHPVWLITTVGLQQSIINSITICKYRKDEGLIEGTECSICLNEFQESETLRLLPKCNHAFHIPCIDTWLRSHTNCPLCRACIVSNNVDHEVAMSNLEQENNNLGRNQETLIENSRNDGEVGESSEVFEFSDESNQNHGCYTKTCKTMRRSMIEECLRIRPVPMKRSFSWNGRVLSTRGYMNIISILRY